MSRFCAFWWHFLAHFVTLCYFLAFLALLGLLGLLRCFVANWICLNFRTFLGKIVLAQTMFVQKKKLSFCMFGLRGNINRHTHQSPNALMGR